MNEFRFITSGAAGRSFVGQPGMMVITVLPEVIHTNFYEINHLPRSVNLFGR